MTEREQCETCGRYQVRPDYEWNQLRPLDALWLQRQGHCLSGFFALADHPEMHWVEEDQLFMLEAIVNAAAGAR